MENKKNEPSNQKVYLNGYIDVPADRLQAVEEALFEHISLTCSELGLYFI